MDILNKTKQHIKDLESITLKGMNLTPEERIQLKDIKNRDSTKYLTILEKLYLDKYYGYSGGDIDCPFYYQLKKKIC